MSNMKLLVSESPLVVLPTLAKTIGLNEAIVLQQIQYWLSNPAVGFWKDGRKWVHNTYEEWHKNFPFWSIDTVKRAIKSLEDSGLVLSEQSSSNPFDKTKSYSIDYEALSSVRDGNLHPSEDGNLPPSFTETTTETTNTAEVVPTLPATYSPEWQILAGQKSVEYNHKQAQMIDSANLIAMGMGSLTNYAYNISLTFMQERGIVIDVDEAKGQRKVVKALHKAGATPEHVRDAVRELMSKGMTVVDLYSVAKTATALANPPEVKYTGPIEGV